MCEECGGGCGEDEEGEGERESRSVMANLQADIIRLKRELEVM